MKLTNNMRDAFVSAVMQDVPKIDYESKFQKIAEDHCLEKLPKEIVKIYRNNALRGFLKYETVSVRHERYESVVSASLLMYDTYSVVKANLAALPEVQAITVAKQKQSDSLAGIRQKLREAILSVSTVKQAQELLPEFSEYLPKPSDKPSKFAPAVIANLAADLAAAGWPKEKTKGEK